MIGWIVLIIAGLAGLLAAFAGSHAIWTALLFVVGVGAIVWSLRRGGWLSIIGIIVGALLVIFTALPVWANLQQGYAKLTGQGPIVVDNVCPAESSTGIPLQAGSIWPNCVYVQTGTGGGGQQGGNGGGVTGHCDVLAVTSLPARSDSTVNDTIVTLQVRDTNNCGRPLWYNESGVAKGANYAMKLAQGWTAVTASVSVQVHPDGGSPSDFTGGPVVVIRGPWSGNVGLYEGAVRVYPDEWVDAALNSEVLPIQRTQVGDQNLQPIYLGGIITP